MAGQDAFKMAKKESSNVDVAEIHDAFSVCEPMTLESLGFTKDGKGIDMVKDLHNTDNFKINPRGGLIGAGHPLGATGIAQTIEITQQLQSSAANRQVDNPHVGLVHNMSAAATSSTVLVLEKMSFEDKLENGEFCIPECTECKKIVWPPSEICNHCFGKVNLKNGEFVGKIIEYSRKDDQFFCMVEFEKTIRIISQMDKEPQIGQTVKISHCGIRERNYFFKVS